MMRKITKRFLVNLLIIVFIISISVIFINSKKHPETTDEVAKCIGKNSVLYVQLGCPHCEEQKEIFGDNIKYINTIDCFFEREICSNEKITSIPTWKINGKFYTGVKSIEQLKETTGCN